MKIVFVNPPVTKKERYGALAAAGAYSPPLALCSLAAITRKEGYDTAIIDSQVEELDHKATLKRIDDFSPHIVGITSTTSTFLSAAELAEKIKKKDKKATVLAGGVHFSALPEESLQKHKHIDMGVIGEGEETIRELLPFIIKRGDLSSVKGIAYRKDNKVVITEPRSLIKELDQLPLPAWDLLPDFPHSYNLQAQSVANFPSTSICTSRGCTGKCTFCDRRIFGSQLRALSAEQVMNMIRELYYTYGLRDLQFEDDNFMLFRKRLFSICDMLRREKLDITWSCQARVDMVNLEVLEAMREGGCWMVLYGIESGSKKVLDYMQKNITLERIERAIELTHKAGIQCKGFFISGFLNEDRESLEETYQFIRKAKLDDISFHYYTPFPGSAAYEVASQHGTIKGDINDMTYYKPVFVPKGLKEEDLILHTKACYKAFYLRPTMVLSYLRRIKSPRHFYFFLKSFIALIKYFLTKKE